jgi:hypothetical protein
VATVSPGLALKPVGSGFLFRPQNQQLCFSDLCFKITVMVSWFMPQNQANFDLSVVPQNRWREDSVGHASRSDGLLRLEASRGRISRSSLKTGGGATAGGVEAEDGWVDATGCVRPFYHKITNFYVLGPRGNLVF